MALVPYAAEVLHRLLKEFKPADIAISSYGIRGMLYEVMPDDMRAADPLLAACRFVGKDARVPGFGDRLYVHPLFADAEEDFQRLIRPPAYYMMSVGALSRFSRKSVFRNSDVRIWVD